MSDSRVDDVVARYFDIVQQEIKKLISQDHEIKPEQVQQFNDEIFNQPDEIQAEIRQYIDKATQNNLDIPKIAKIIYDKFKLQVKNNIFDQKDAQNVPNPMLGERKHIKRFDSFVNEASYFHSMSQIDDILDRIKANGYESLDDSDRAILLNFSKDDDDIYNILLKMNELTKQFLKLNKKISVLIKTDTKELETAKKEWLTLNNKLSVYENMLRYLYKIEDPKDIWDYQEKQGLTIENKKNK